MAGILSRLKKLFARKKPAEPPAPKRVMHWSPGPEGLPMCGASARGALWTLEFEHANCAQCRIIGWTMKIQADVNTR